jgi:hypothetical protein
MNVKKAISETLFKYFSEHKENIPSFWIVRDKLVQITDDGKRYIISSFLSNLKEILSPCHRRSREK